MKVLGIVQARMASTRLPGKVMRPILGNPMIEMMLKRLSKSTRLNEITVATTVSSFDDQVAELADRLGISWVHGSEDDVLSRFSQAARELHADVVVRLTADCPLHDPVVIDAAIHEFLCGEPCDYLSNTLERTFPDGLDVEIFTREALQKAEEGARRPHEREHVTPYIYADPDVGRFRLRSFLGPADFSHLRWTVDNRDDAVFVEEVYRDLHPRNPDFGWLDVLALITRHPEMIRTAEQL